MSEVEHKANLTGKERERMIIKDNHKHITRFTHKMSKDTL